VRAGSKSSLRVLAIDDRGHLLKRAGHLLPVGEAVMKPIGNVLAGDPQGGSIFHQANIVNIGNF
jgi:hypothetical protein